MAYSVMSDYDRFCKRYDAVMRDPKQKAVFLKSLIKKRNPSGTTLLELACGTGAVLQYFADDFEIFGLDLSAGMLSVARKRLPRVPLSRQDMRKFAIPRSFDTICLRLRLDQPPPEVQRLVQGIRSGEASFE